MRYMTHALSDLKKDTQSGVDFKVERLLQGFEFGHGKISGVAAKREVLATVDEAIKHDERLLVPIGKDDEGHQLDDDGCGDGRRVLTVFTYDTRFKRNLNRSKVFGGAATMTMSTLIGLGHAERENLNNMFNKAIAKLDQLDIGFGAHTDETMHGSSCGCGAIDKAPQILLAILKYEIPIRGVVTILSDDYTGLDEVYKNFRRYVSELADQTDYSGMQVIEAILNNPHSPVVKQLGGVHRECRIVLNKVRGHTVNQKLIRDLTDNEAQVFAVDVWRMKDLAKKLYEDNPSAQKKAFIAELIYTVATAAVLTKGDLPVDLVSRA